jgi:hypothetical protein
VTVTDATGIGVTVTVAVAIFVSLTAATVATPEDTAVTSPLAETVATAGSPLLQETSRPESTLFLASRVSVTSWTVDPSTRLVDGGLRVIEATGAGVTVIVAVAVFPSLVAVMLDVPAETAVTTP